MGSWDLRLEKVGGNGQTAHYVPVKGRRNLEDPQVAVETDGGVGKSGRRFRAELYRPLLAILQFQGNRVAVFSKTASGTILGAVSDPEAGRQAAEIAHGLLHGEILDAALRARGERPTMLALVQNLACFAVLANGHGGHLVLFVAPEL